MADPCAGVSLRGWQPLLRPEWVDYFPVVAPQPHLADPAHAAAYAACLGRRDLVGALEAVVAGLGATRRSADEAVYGRAHAQVGPPVGCVGRRGWRRVVSNISGSEHVCARACKCSCPNAYAYACVGVWMCVSVCNQWHTAFIYPEVRRAIIFSGNYHVLL